MRFSFSVNYTCFAKIKISSFHLNAQHNIANQPMLTNEYFKTDSIVSNTFDVSLQNVGVSITVPASFKNKGKPQNDLSQFQNCV